MSSLRIILLSLATVGLAVARYFYPGIEVLAKAFDTALVLTVVDIVGTILKSLALRKITDLKTRYTVQKTVNILSFIALIVVVIGVWVENPQILLVSYGVIGAGIAVAIQDLLKNFVGGIILFISHVYRVGDRIEIEGKLGDVIDIGILFTTVLEIKEWVAGDQPTGRMTSVPNSQVINKQVNNYTKDHEFIWDEIMIPITYDSDWQEAMKLTARVVKKQTKETMKAAEKDIKRLRQRFYMLQRVVEPVVFLTMTDNWVQTHVRYVTGARSRRVTNSKISELLLKEFQKRKSITIASQTVDIIGMPDLKVKRK